jgi:hypothetical protein
MVSGENLDKLEEERFKFIIGSLVAKVPYEIEEYRRKEKQEKLALMSFVICLKSNKL